MWKNGKFNGKGKLTFDMYLYEGDFVEGVFHGHGSLKTEGMNFMGIFRNHMADGEGTVIKNGENISGIWSKNKFVQSFWCAEIIEIYFIINQTIEINKMSKSLKNSNKKSQKQQTSSTKKKQSSTTRNKLIEFLKKTAELERKL